MLSQTGLQLKDKNKKNILLLLIVLLLVKLSYLIVLIIYNGQFPHSSEELFSLFYQNDSGWYRSIAENGYKDYLMSNNDGQIIPFDQNYQTTWAFFPLYPKLCSLFMYLFNTSFVKSAFIISLIFSSSALIMFYKLMDQMSANKTLAFFSALLFLVFPFNFHLSMYYTEAVFYTFLFIAFWATYKRKYFWLVLSTSCMCLLRPNGLVLLLPIWIFTIEQWVPKNISPKAKIKKLFFASFMMLPAFFCFVAYLFYQYKLTGYYNIFSMAQLAWGKHYVFPFFGLFRGGDDANFYNSIYVIIIMLFSIWNLKKMPLSFNILIWISLLLPLSAGSAVSMSRYTCLLFPLFFILGKALFRYRFKNWILILMLLIQLYPLLYLWHKADPFSY